jgi:hypothetical protein
MTLPHPLGLPEAREALQQALLLREHRAVIAMFLVPARDSAALEATVLELLQEQNIHPGATEIHRFSGAKDDIARLGRLNLARDLLLSSRRLILLLAHSYEAVRCIRTVGNDLMSAPDVWAEVQALPPPLATPGHSQAG